jgi:TolA-binding protein
MKHYSDAIASFQKVIAFAHSSKKSAAQMMIGNCYMAMKSRTKAKDAYETLIKKYPASLYARRAKEKLKTL